MFSSRPERGNPWPHDMRISVENGSHALLDLLWIRQAWVLEPVGDDLPPFLLATPSIEPEAADADLEGWSDAWPEMWRRCLEHAAVEPDRTAFERLTTIPSGPSPEREELLAGLVGPSWRDSFGDAAFTERHQAWIEATFTVLTSRATLRRTPERDCVEQLVPAWRAGLTRIVAIPCRGAFTRRVGDHALLVTEATRDVTGDYADALRSFA